MGPCKHRGERQSLGGEAEGGSGWDRVSCALPSSASFLKIYSATALSLQLTPAQQSLATKCREEPGEGGDFSRSLRHPGALRTKPVVQD